MTERGAVERFASYFAKLNDEMRKRTVCPTTTGWVPTFLSATRIRATSCATSGYTSTWRSQSPSAREA